MFDELFTTGGYLIVQQPPQTQPAPGLPDNVTHYLRERSSAIIFLSDTVLPEGPYFAVGRQLHQAWRLYPDNLSSFVTAVIPRDEATSNSELNTR